MRSRFHVTTTSRRFLPRVQCNLQRIRSLHASILCSPVLWSVRRGRARLLLLEGGGKARRRACKAWLCDRVRRRARLSSMRMALLHLRWRARRQGRVMLVLRRLLLARGGMERVVWSRCRCVRRVVRPCRPARESAAVSTLLSVWVLSC